MSDERKRQRSTPDPDEYDEYVSDTPSEKKKKQEDDESSEKVIIYTNNTPIVFFH